jgi:YidC/Oxa1 family membrane protein insertase
LRDYKNLTPSNGLVELGTENIPLLRFRVVSGSDTILLDRAVFHLERSRLSSAIERLTYDTGVDSIHATISYELDRDSYVAHVRGRIAGVGRNGFLLIDLPSTIRPAESDTIADLRALSVSFKPDGENAGSIAFSRLDPGARQLVSGPIVWTAVKNKYFVLGLLNPRGGSFSEVLVEGGPRTTKLATSVRATVVKAIPDGTFALDIYAGPQQSTQLIAVGRDFDHVNPYGWRFLQGVVQPIAALCIRLLLWMHQVMQLSYGWVLVIFGIVVRIVLWPLNQSAMRSSLKMQEIQPKLAEVQKKYKDKPEKQREEIMRVYKEAGASPFTALSGCLPALIPMPVLFALFFVFQNTIEFRGVPFFWLHDISIKDPLYILPVLMGISMYVLSWIGLRNAPPNPQAKMMSYMFPAMMTFFLANMASGLNLYYTAQNIAALPQQWMLARERAKAKARLSR